MAAQPIGAPTWFPCNDRPDDRARYSITVDDRCRLHRRRHRGASSGAARRGQFDAGTFRADVPTATYLTALHIGRYVSSHAAGPAGSDGLPVAVVHPPALARRGGDGVRAVSRA